MLTYAEGNVGYEAEEAKKNVTSIANVPPGIDVQISLKEEQK